MPKAKASNLTSKPAASKPTAVPKASAVSKTQKPAAATTNSPKTSSPTVAPKRNLSPYFMYMQERRPQLKAEQPNLANTALTSKMGEEWKSLSDAAKDKYIAQANKDKQRYIKELESYSPPEDAPKPKGRQGKKKAKDLNAPKKPMTAFFFFQGEVREKVKKDNPELKQKELVTKIGAMWRAAGAKDKEKFEQMAKKDRVRYEKEKKDYDRGKGESEGDREATKEDEEDDEE